MERKNLPVRITCLICSHEICTTSTPSAFSAEELFRLFHNFSKRMNWHASGSGVEAFDFHEDPFPFCKPCEGILAEVTTLTEEADRIQKRIQELTGNAASKILLSLDNTNLDHSLETDDEELKEERRKKRRKYSKETESRIVCMQKVNHFRSETIRSYSPYVRISKEDSNAGRIAKATRKNKVPKKQRSSKTKGKENRKKTGESSLTTESEYDNETESSNELNRPNNWQCSKCQKIFSGRSTLKRHFVFCGGKSVVTKLNDDEYIFEDFQFRKTDNGFECETCEASYQSQQNMKYHIRKIHSGGSTSMEESLNEGDEERDEEAEESSEFTKSPGRPGKRKRKAGETIVKRKVLGKVRMNILKAYASMFQRAQEKDLISTHTTTSKRISCQHCGESFCSNFSLRRHMGKSSCRNGLPGVEDQDD